MGRWRADATVGRWGLLALVEGFAVVLVLARVTVDDPQGRMEGLKLQAARQSHAEAGVLDALSVVVAVAAFRTASKAQLLAEDPARPAFRRAWQLISASQAYLGT